MSTTYQLIKKGDFEVQLGEHSNVFDLEIIKPELVDSGVFFQVSVNNLSAADIKELGFKILEIYSYWADPRGTIAELIKRCPELNE